MVVVGGAWFVRSGFEDVLPDEGRGTVDDWERDMEDGLGWYGGGGVGATEE